ncbi:C-terminal helicase domain-containing protein [Streptomyces parvus]|uniref:C-terminal helicase domain-containing protein n=1 Tax=Streptomyces TaxID=1883 RepID=UPI000997471B|nr:C-terminal helicase domain-containing protein [Streptomyces griseus]
MVAAGGDVAAEVERADLTLTQASHVVLFNRPWNPAKESQAIVRAPRLGQTRTVTVHQLTTENTLHSTDTRPSAVSTTLRVNTPRW